MAPEQLAHASCRRSIAVSKHRGGSDSVSIASDGFRIAWLALPQAEGARANGAGTRPIGGISPQQALVHAAGPPAAVRPRFPAADGVDRQGRGRTGSPD